MKLSQLLPDLVLSQDPQIGGLVLDSRHIRAGDAFVAIAGFGAHGLGFVEQAKAAGAAAILFDPPAPAELPAPVDAAAEFDAALPSAHAQTPPATGGTQ